jgi:hypothetical protein
MNQATTKYGGETAISYPTGIATPSARNDKKRGSLSSYQPSALSHWLVADCFFILFRVSGLGFGILPFALSFCILIFALRPFRSLFHFYTANKEWSGEKFINITSAFNSIKDNTFSFFHLTAYSVITHSYPIIILIALYLLHIWYSEDAIKLGNFLKH